MLMKSFRMLFFYFVLFAIIQNNASAQSWNLLGNADATATSKLGTTNSQPVRIFVKDSEKMRIDSQGRVSIGTADPISLLTVRSNGITTPSASYFTGTVPLITGLAQTTTGNGDVVLVMGASSSVQGFPRVIGRKARGNLAAPAIASHRK